MPTFPSTPFGSIPFCFSAHGIGQKSDGFLYPLRFLSLSKCWSKENTVSRSSQSPGSGPVSSNLCYIPFPMAKLTYANAQSADSGPGPKSLGGWLRDALMLSLATQSLQVVFLPFRPSPEPGRITLCTQATHEWPWINDMTLPS